MRSAEDIAWAAGVFEGEGSFSTRPDARITMCDLDIIERFRDVMGFGTIRPVYPQSERHRMAWKWMVGSHEHYQATGAMFWKYLGVRRREQFKRGLAMWSGRRRVYEMVTCPECGFKTKPGPMGNHLKAHGR